jgi:hypothetical protein
MGLSRRKRSPDRFIGGSKLNVPGQGIFSVKLIDNDKEPVGPQDKTKSHSRPKPETTTTTTTIPVIDYKQFQDYVFFEFMDGEQYDFQN